MSFVVVHPWIVVHSVAVFCFNPCGVVSFGYDEPFVFIAAAVCHRGCQRVVDALFVEGGWCHGAVVAHSWWYVFGQVFEYFVISEKSELVKVNDIQNYFTKLFCNRLLHISRIPESNQIVNNIKEISISINRKCRSSLP